MDNLLSKMDRLLNLGLESIDVSRIIAVCAIGLVIIIIAVLNYLKHI